MDFVKKVADRLKISKEETAKLRTIASIAGADSEKKVEAVLAGMRKGADNTVAARALVSRAVDFPRRIDECPLCYAHMQPVTLAGNRPATFCPVHNVVMPVIE